MENEQIKKALKNWRLQINKFQKPDAKKAVVQILNTFLPFLGLVVLMYFSLSWSYFLTLGLSVPAAFFLIRIFIIQHDCGHQSFLKSRKWNNRIGFIASFFSTIPFKYWNWTHSAHHAFNGQMEHRGLGDIYFLTKEEYAQRSAMGKFRYRLYRSPVVLFLLAPALYLLILQRFPFTKRKEWKKYRRGFFVNNYLILLAYIGLSVLLGWQTVLLIFTPILLGFGIIAFWFFYIQHQHPENYNEEQDNWSHLLASIRGSTFYKLPRLFQWLSGNIGFHHIHHLNSRIPNYNLEACTRANPHLNTYANILTFGQSLKCIHFKLWDAQTQRMISFKEFKLAGNR